MQAPQIIIIALYAMALLLNSHLHGKERTGKYNFWTTLVGTIMQLSILYWGGFFHELSI
jgi:hypothetical protein